MNIIFHALLFYIYSGIALAGLCAGKANELTQGLYNPDGEDEAAEKMRTQARDRIVVCAQNIGNQFANSTTLSIVGGFQGEVIANYEAAKKHNAAVEEQRQEALKLVTPINKLGA